MKKNDKQLEFDFLFDSKCKKISLSKKPSNSKVEEELLKVLKEPDVRTTSNESLDEHSKEDEFFVNLITTEELAVIFGLAPQTIRNWVTQGKLPYVKIGRRNLFLKRSVQEWVNRKEEPQWR